MDRVAIPEQIRALLFDVDGVLTDTASVHAAAWKEAFDWVLEQLGTGPPFSQEDYVAHVDGRTRLDGVRGFLAAREIELPEGDPSDAADALTVQGIGKRKNDLVLELIRTKGVPRYDDAERFVRAARKQGYKTAVVSSSANAREALRAAGLEDCFDTWVDGIRIDRDGLPGKPAPDTFLAAASDLGAPPDQAAVFEDALAGVEAGRAGDFGWVLGVDRIGHAEDLLAHGADVTVSDLGEIALER